MTDRKQTSFLMPPFILGGFFLAYLCVWATLYLNIYMNTDLGWLLTCLERFMQGGTYTDSFYETNPPLSFLIYLPSYLLYKILNLSPNLALMLNFSAYILLTALLIYRYMILLEISQTLMIGLFGAFIFTQTWMLSGGFGQKDQLIYLFLIPYAMMQIAALSEKRQPFSLKSIAAFLGAVSVCIKPHYILIPVCFFFYRIHKKRSITILVSSSDVTIFVITGLSYLFFLNVFFPDYINVILPETATYYLYDEPLPVTARLSLLLFAAAAFFISLFMYETEETRYLKITLFLIIGLALVSSVPYLLQNKGFTYQTIPFFGFSVMSAMLAIYGLIYQSSRYADVSAIIQFTVMLMLMHNYMTGAGLGLLSPEEFKNLPYHQKIEKLAWNKVYTDLELKPLNLSLPYYSDLKNGSRFGQLWPVHGLNLAFTKAKTEKEKNDIKTKINNYITLIAEDIERNNPSVISIPRYIVEGSGVEEPQKNYYNTLMKNERFSSSLAKYDLSETFTYDESLYLRGSPKLEKKIRTTDLFVLKRTGEETGKENEKK